MHTIVLVCCIQVYLLRVYLLYKVGEAAYWSKCIQVYIMIPVYPVTVCIPPVYKQHTGVNAYRYISCEYCMNTVHTVLQLCILYEYMLCTSSV